MTRYTFPLIAALGAVIGAGAVWSYDRFASPGGPDQARIERVVHDYVLSHPEIIPQAMQKLQDQQSGQAVAANRRDIETPFGSAWAGNPKGDVTVSVFMDYACGYCRASLPGLAELIAKDPNVRVVYREYPVLGDASVTAARFALAAAQQGKFRPFHDALFASDGPSNASISAALAKAGLDPATTQKLANSDAIAKEIEANHRLGAKLAMNGTPAWVVGKQILYGARDYQALADAVAAARKAK